MEIKHIHQRLDAWMSNHQAVEFRETVDRLPSCLNEMISATKVQTTQCRLEPRQRTSFDSGENNVGLWNFQQQFF